MLNKNFLLIIKKITSMNKSKNKITKIWPAKIEKIVNSITFNCLKQKNVLS